MTQMRAEIDDDFDAADWRLEQQEWLEAMDGILQEYGNDKAEELLNALRQQCMRQGLSWFGNLNTPYCNTIPPTEQPPYPGDMDMERRIENILRWNAMAMVLQANDKGTGVGGHIATYFSTATLFEVGFNHFFKPRSETYGGDILFLQPHAAPGVYARAFLEGRLSRQQVENFRQQLQEGGGLPSYPHPRHMPDFWQLPNASMGLAAVTGIYHARFIKYLERRGLKRENGGKVWVFIGDGESDEPEVLGTLNIAVREQLNNLIFVVNCNLQRLDGPVRGNGKIIQELERTFRGAGWNVIKVIWGSEWDALFARDIEGVLQARMDRAVDGDYQMYSVLPGNKVREHWVQGNPKLAALMQCLTDEEIRTIKRGGFDHAKTYAAYNRAVTQSSDKPTVILAKTIKGLGLGGQIEGKNIVHQKKQLKPEERLACARRFGIPLSDEAVRAAELYRPDDDSEEMQYLQTRRQALGGYVPTRDQACPKLAAPSLDLFSDAIKGSNERAISTTMVFVRILSKLLRDKALGKYIVPIVPDEARTFGMDGLFAQAGIYSCDGQLYTPVDAQTVTPYRESKDGQILEEGVCEAGAIASFLAAGTAYSLHKLPMIPFYVFYSIFGFQRVGDIIWSCGDSLCRGFLIGGTSGRTTLNGEGLQHQDGHSQVVANTIPNLVSYDPAFGYELAIIIREGIRRMFEAQEDVFYYVTVTNQNQPMPPMPEGVGEGVIKGMYRFRPSSLQSKGNKRAHLLGSGAIMAEVLRAQKILEEKYSISTDVWSVTSYNELSRDILATERWNRLHPKEEPKVPYIGDLLKGESGCFIAASDYMKVLPQGIAGWVPGPFCSLGTDGYGLSESRSALRDYFEVSAEHIVIAALSTLARHGHIDTQEAASALQDFKIDPNKPDPILR